MFKLYLESYFGKEVEMNFTKVVPADVNSPGRELSVRGLGFVVALSDRW